MKVVVITPWYSKNMGYGENFLPAALAKAGAETHVVTSNTQIYYNHPNYREIYEPYIGPAFVDCGEETINGYTLHRLPRIIFNPGAMPDIKGLYGFLSKLKPDAVQALEIDHPTSFTAALYCFIKGVNFYTECHVHASVMGQTTALKRREARESFLNNFKPRLRFINFVTRKCFPIAEDVKRIAINHYKVPNSKIEVQSLGVDTTLFHPIANSNEEKMRRITRKKLGFKPDDIVCIYTGRFTESKNPFLLAEAVQLINPKFKVRALFVGRGDAESMNRLRSNKRCIVHDFVPVEELPAFYHASDIGVWPKEESTSQLDAAACGLPIIISENVSVRERAEGNGLFYKQDDAGDLASKIQMLHSKSLRKQMGGKGAKKIARMFSWDSIARSRIALYSAMMKP